MKLANIRWAFLLLAAAMLAIISTIAASPALSADAPTYFLQPGMYKCFERDETMHLVKIVSAKAEVDPNILPSNDDRLTNIRVTVQYESNFFSGIVTAVSTMSGLDEGYHRNRLHGQQTIDGRLEDSFFHLAKGNNGGAYELRRLIFVRSPWATWFGIPFGRTNIECTLYDDPDATRRACGSSGKFGAL